MRTARRGTTLADLILAIALAVVLIPTATAMVYRSRETADRVKCGSNLKQIGQAILLYANENRGAYPRTRYDPATADRPRAWTGAESTHPYADDGPDANDVTAAYRRLLATQDLESDVFACPSSPLAYDYGLARERTKRLAANFIDERELGYSFANPYPTSATRGAGYKLDLHLTAEFAVAADINPGIAPPHSDVTAVTLTDSAHDMRRGNSPNHGKDGQNVLYGDGHVEFQQSAFVGFDRDNIYTFGKRGDAIHGDVGPPANPRDSVLLPTLDPTRWQSFRDPHESTRVVWWIAAMLAIAALGIFGWARRERSHTRTIERSPLPSA